MQTRYSNSGRQPANPHIQSLEQEDCSEAYAVLARTAVLVIGVAYLLQHSEQTRLLKLEWIGQNILWLFPATILLVSYLIYKGYVSNHLGVRSRFVWFVISFFALTAPIVLVCLIFSCFTALGYSTWIFTYDPLNAATIASLCLLTPIANLWLLPVLLKGEIENPPVAGILNGFALGTSVLFGVLFLPGVGATFTSLLCSTYYRGPLEYLLAILLAVLIVSPYSVTLLSCWQCKAIWGLRDTDKGLQASVFACLGLVVSVLLLLCPGVSTVVTNVATVKAATQGSEASSSVRWLRAFESSDELMRKAYFQNIPKLEVGSAIWSIICNDKSVASAPSAEMARKAIYRITGRNFNTFKKPAMASMPSWWTTFDQDRGGSAVGGVSSNLTMALSHMDCICYKDALASRVEWEFTFTNANGSADEEARVLIMLPPNAVASGLSLIVNGKRRDAIYGSRGVVRTAYSNIVVETRRDPALLSWAGNDRVLLQCFPVRAGSPMKVTMQVAAPFVMSSQQRGQIMLPRIIESNCELTNHRIRYRVQNQGTFEGGFDKIVSNDLLSDPIATIDGVARQASLVDPIEGGVLQQRVQSSVSANKQILFVIDCGVNTQDKINSLCDAIAKLSDDVQAGVLYATDEFDNQNPPVRAKNNLELSQLVRQYHPRCLGGPDNVPALKQAIAEMNRNPQLSVIWAHGPQPVVFARDGELDLTFAKNDKSSRPLYEIEMLSGPNKISEYVGTALFETRRPFEILRGTGNFEKSISDVLIKFVGQTTAFEIARSHTPTRRYNAGDAPVMFCSGSQTNAQLTACALWANDQSNEFYSNGRISQAADFSKRHRIVNRCSSAVVLERDADYTEAGLDAMQSDPYANEPIESVAAPTNAVTRQLDSLSCAAASAGTPGSSNYTYSSSPFSSATSAKGTEQGEQIFAIFLWVLASIVGVVIVLGFCKKDSGRSV